MTPNPPPTRLDDRIGALLRGLRWRVRGYVLAEGLLAALAWTGLAFWISLAVDWLLEPPVAVRGGLLAAAAAGLAGVLYWFILRRIFVPLADHSMALLLERRYGQFHDSLVTAVNLAEQPARAAEFDREMLTHTAARALTHTGAVRLRSVFRFAPLLAALAAAVVLGISVAGYAWRNPHSLAVWTDRALLMSDQLWPRRTRLVVEGFDGEGVIKIARGTDFRLLVQADASMVVPERVWVDFRTDDGAGDTRYLNRRGVAVPERDEFQEYTLDFERVHASMTLDVGGGDARRRDLRIEVVDSPTIHEMTLRCEYPAYMTGRDRNELAVSGLMEVPLGTRVRIVAEANKPLVGARVSHLAEGEKVPLRSFEFDTSGEEGGRHFEMPLDRVLQNLTLLFTLSDTDGITVEDAVRLDLRALPDETPQVAVRLAGIGSAITPAARLPIVGRVTDDYGLSRAWFEYQVDEGPPARSEFVVPAHGRFGPGPEGEKDGGADAGLDVRDFNPRLTPGQKLHVAVKAADSFDVTGSPNVGTGERYQLDVVAVDQLRVMLDTREVQLRRRLETMIQELTETRDSLDKIVPDDGVDADADGGAAKADSDGLSPEQRAARRIARVERVAQNTQRSRYELRQLAASFEAIALELSNNRIYDAQVQQRLKRRIAGRMRGVADQGFKPLDGPLAQLRRLAGDAADAEAAVADSRRVLDGVLTELQAVLLEIKDVTALGDLLAGFRDLLDSQARVTRLTEAEKKKKSKTLLDDLESTP